jgi:hypothetical protein
MISIIHPSRSRPDISFNNIRLWMHRYSGDPSNLELIVSLDEDDPYLTSYSRLYRPEHVLISKNKSSVEAVNAGAKKSTGQILIVVGDDTDCLPSWNVDLYKAVEGKTDWILKTQDGIQPWIITMPVMDRKYFDRTGYIYHPGFDHMFCDTYMSCVADINGRRITSPLMFPHNNDSIKDDLRKRTDATWKQGEETFIKLMKQFTPEERSRIQDHSMKNWLRNKGVR